MVAMEQALKETFAVVGDGLRFVPGREAHWSSLPRGWCSQHRRRCASSVWTGRFGRGRVAVAASGCRLHSVVLESFPKRSSSGILGAVSDGLRLPLTLRVAFCSWEGTLWLFCLQYFSLSRDVSSGFAFSASGTAPSRRSFLYREL